MKKSMSLKELYKFGFPEEDEIIWEYVRPHEVNDQYKLIQIDPVAWANYKHEDGESYLSRFKKYAESEQKNIVKKYRLKARKIAVDPEESLVVSSAISEVLDGQHRLVAMALEKIRSAYAIDIAIPVDEDSGS